MKKKYSIQFSKNDSAFMTLANDNDFFNATRTFLDYVIWYKASPQRIDTEFTIRLRNNETNEVVDIETLPIKELV